MSSKITRRFNGSVPKRYYEATRHADQCFVTAVGRRDPFAQLPARRPCNNIATISGNPRCGGEAQENILPDYRAPE
jgi:hypothetical protein